MYGLGQRTLTPKYPLGTGVEAAAADVSDDEELPMIICEYVYTERGICLLCSGGVWKAAQRFSDMLCDELIVQTIFSKPII
jgi:hypothetical protein